jgi:hypothetical protein
MRITTPIRALVAAGSIAAVMAVGSAFTASNTVPATATVGYGETTISGVTASSIVYNTNAAGNTLTSVTVTLAGDTTGKDIKVNFNTDAATLVTGTFLSPSTTYTFTPGTPPAANSVTSFAVVAGDHVGS